MSFRRRNVGISDGRQPHSSPDNTQTQSARLPGIRSSAVDGKPVTSTGVAAFDGIFAGHGGQPLGTSVLIGESGTTDYAGALLRFYAAQGLMQDHHVHVVGLPETWARELPGLASESSKKSEVQTSEKMKIAWRYESLGQQSAEVARGGSSDTNRVVLAISHSILTLHREIDLSIVSDEYIYCCFHCVLPFI